jgi:hypothetical protein
MFQPCILELAFFLGLIFAQSCGLIAGSLLQYELKLHEYIPQVFGNSLGKFKHMVPTVPRRGP